MKKVKVYPVKYCSAVVAPPLFHRARAKAEEKKSEEAKERGGDWEKSQRVKESKNPGVAFRPLRLFKLSTF